MKKNLIKNFVLTFCLVFIPIFAVITFPAQVSGQSVIDQSVKNIETFSKLYGYVRFFYPGDEAAKIDWERFAVFGVQKVEKASNTAELKKILEDLFLPVAPTLVIHETKNKSTFPVSSITPPTMEGMKPVYWQHQGYGVSEESIYSSVRINRPQKIKTPLPFYNILTSISGTAFRGKEIKYSASVKVEKGTAQLWFRVDREKNNNGFFDNMQDRIIQPGEWKEYTITGKVDTDASQIYFGCFGNGLSKLYADDFRLEVKNGDNWEPVTLKNPGFENDSKGAFPENWRSQSDNKIISATDETSSTGKMSVKIQSWIEPSTAPIQDPLFEAKPQFGDTISKELGNGLSCIMPVFLYGNTSQTFPETSRQLFDTLNTGLDGINLSKMTGDDLYLRLADVVIIWNVMQHFYPYFDVVKTNWKSELTNALKRAYSDKTKLDFHKTLQLMVAALKDGHGRVNDMSARSMYVPLEFGLAEGNVIIKDILDKNIKGIAIGDVVTEINNVKASEALKDEIQYISGATEGWKQYRGLYELASGENEKNMTLRLDREGEKIDFSIPYSLPTASYYKTLQARGDTWRKIEEGIYYLNIDKLTGDVLAKLEPELEKAKGIICDLRGYPKNTLEIIEHLLKNTENTKWMFVPQVYLPDYEKVTFSEHGWNMKPKTPHWDAKVVFLTDGRAISYAESYMGYIKDFGLATVVGQPTAGTNGNINPFTLPGGFYIIWTGMKVLKHDGTQHHGIGIVPDVPVELTIKAIRDRRDEFLEKALEIIRK